jgi:hypothetical protein
MTGCLQQRCRLHACGLMKDPYERHVSINLSDGHVLFEGSRQTREIGILVSGHCHRIEAIRPRPRAPSCAERPCPGINVVMI